MFDSELDKIFEVYKRVLSETKENVSIRISRSCVDLVVFDNDKVRDMHTAYFYEDMCEVTEKAIKCILDTLTHMLKGGAVDV